MYIYMEWSSNGHGFDRDFCCDQRYYNHSVSHWRCWNFRGVFYMGHVVLDEPESKIYFSKWTDRYHVVKFEFFSVIWYHFFRISNFSGCVMGCYFRRDDYLMSVFFLIFIFILLFWLTKLPYGLCCFTFCQDSL